MLSISKLLYVVLDQGTNFGMKNHSASLKPTMGMDSSAQTLNLQSDIKAAQLEEIIFKDYKYSNKKWSNTPTAPYTTTFGEGLIKEVYCRLPLYVSKRVDVSTFQVLYEGCEASVDIEDLKYYEDVPLPLFDRVREVTIDHSGVMFCSCQRFESRGIFCEHLLCVATSIHKHSGIAFDGFTHHDIALRYRTAYMHYAYKKETPDHIQAAFHTLSSHAMEPKGPTLKVSIPGDMLVYDRQPSLPAIDRLKNYDKDGVNVDRIDGLFSSTFTPSMDDPNNNDDVNDIFQEMVYDIQQDTSVASEVLFNTSVENHAIPDTMAGVNTRTAMRSLVDTSFELADRIGNEGVKEFERKMKEFHTWASDKLEQSGDSDKNKKRKYVPMTQEAYKGTADRVFNTYTMR